MHAPSGFENLRGFYGVLSTRPRRMLLLLLLLPRLRVLVVLLPAATTTPSPHPAAFAFAFAGVGGGGGGGGGAGGGGGRSHPTRNTMCTGPGRRFQCWDPGAMLRQRCLAFRSEMSGQPNYKGLCGDLRV